MGSKGSKQKRSKNCPPGCAPIGCGNQLCPPGYKPVLRPIQPQVCPQPQVFPQPQICPQPQVYPQPQICPPQQQICPPGCVPVNQYSRPF